MNYQRRVFLLLMLMQQSGSAFAQTPLAVDEVDTIEEIVSAVHGTLSGPAGERRDWDKFRQLFKPEARFITSPHRADGSGYDYNARSLETVVRSMDEWLSVNSLYETPVNLVTERFGHLAHVFATYESRKNADDPEPTYGRGISSFQLLHDGTRWWVVNWYWVGERPESPIPQRYLPN